MSYAEDNGWVQQSEWQGNPSLGLESWKKLFVNPFNGRKVPVFVFGKEGYGEHRPCKDAEGNITHYRDFPDWQFVVSAGNHSDYSYSGSFYPKLVTLKGALQEVDELYNNNKLFK